MNTATVFQDKETVSTRLAELGLSEGILRDAVARGQVARDSCSANFPVVTVGGYAWGATVAGLREGLIPLGWRRNSEGLLEATINSAGTIAVTVSTGDGDTGLPNGTPRTKNQKGPATASVCQKNLQLSLLDKLPGYEQPASSDPTVSPDMVTWVLLMHRHGEETHCELSLPVSMGLDAHVDEWKERIILEAVSFGGVPLVAPVEEQSPDIDIEVSRRSK